MSFASGCAIAPRSTSANRVKDYCDEHRRLPIGTSTILAHRGCSKQRSVGFSGSVPACKREPLLPFASYRLQRI